MVASTPLSNPLILVAILSIILTIGFVGYLPVQKPEPWETAEDVQVNMDMSFPLPHLIARNVHAASWTRRYIRILTVFFLTKHAINHYHHHPL